MAIIRESTDLQLPGSVARARWNGYINEMIMESQPGEQWMPFSWRRIEREAEHDVVQFDSTAPGATRVSVALDYPGESDDAEVVTRVRSSLRGDLACFREGAESGQRRAA
jgi:hypothetical protein